MAENIEGIIIPPKIIQFKKSLGSGIMLVRSKNTGELSHIEVGDSVQVCNGSLYNVRDDRIMPTQSFDK